MGQINTNNYPTVNSLADADLLIVENATNGTGTTTPKQLRENAIGTDTLQTSSQTVTGAINELKGEIDAGAGVVCYDVDTITSGYLGGQFSGSANLLLLHLTTDGTADATNGYMMMLSYTRPVARFAYGRLVDADGVAYKQDVYADNTIICKISNSGEGTESDPKQVVILGIINAGFMLTPTAVVSDRDIIDGQGNTLSVLAEALTKTASGNPVVISDCAGGKARSLKTTINAIQDLHGYDKPWVGGAYKNKMQLTVARIKAVLNPGGTWNGNTFSINNGTFTIVTDNDDNVTGIMVNGNFSAPTNFFLGGGIVAGDYILNGCPANGSDSTYYLAAEANGTWFNRDYGNGKAINGAISNIAITVITTEVTFVNKMFYPMVRLATETDASFAPYSNECPISGRDRVAVDDTGKNLAFASTGNNTVIANNIKSGTYTFSCKNTGNVGINIKANSQDGATLAYTPSASTTNPIVLTFTVSEKCNIFINGYGSGYDSHVSDYQIEEGSVATAFEPYAHSSATIQLGQTVYGADINWDTGVLTPKTTKIVIDGNSNIFTDSGTVGNTAMMRLNITPQAKAYGDFDIRNMKASYLTPTSSNALFNRDELGVATNTAGAAVWFRLPNIKTVADAKTYLTSNPLQVEYELATPTTIQLTPEQLEMLKGYNRITLSDGYGTIELKALTGANWS